MKYLVLSLLLFGLMADATLTPVVAPSVSLPVSLANGGTGVALTAANGGLAYSNASTLALTAPGTAGQTVVSGGAGAPTFGFSSGNTGTGNLFLGSVTPTGRTTGTNDVFVGPNTYALTTGADNVLIGFQSGSGLTTGGQNVIIGSQELKTSTGAQSNVMIGYNNGQNQTTGSSNVYVGDSIANAGTPTDVGNVAVGHSALHNLTGGETNVAIGYQAANNLTTAFNTVAIGLNACSTVTTQNSNVCVGNAANMSANTWTNSMALGNGASAGASNVVSIGNSSVNVGLGGTTVPTARLHVPAVTTAAGTASLKIPAGTVMTSPEQGAIESDGTHLYWTNGSTARVDLAASGGTPGGSNTQFQFNDSSAFGGATDLIWDKVHQSLTLGTSTMTGGDSFAQGSGNIVSGDNAFAHGINNTASNGASHAEGLSCIASGAFSHAEGGTSTSSGNDSHAEGINSTSSGIASHVEGNLNAANAIGAHAEGFGTTAHGSYSHSGGHGTVANGDYQEAVGEYNTPVGTSGASASTDEVFTVGNGVLGTPSTAFAVLRSGLVELISTHLKSLQTSVPTAAPNANAGTGATCTVSNATDIAGKINLTTTATAPSAGAQCAVTFNVAYGVAPICTVTDANNNSVLFSVVNGVYFTTTTTTLVVNYANADAAGHANVWTYNCIETQ